MMMMMMMMMKLILLQLMLLLYLVIAPALLLMLPLSSYVVSARVFSLVLSAGELDGVAHAADGSDSWRRSWR